MTVQHLQLSVRDADCATTSVHRWRMSASLGPFSCAEATYKDQWFPAGSTFQTTIRAANLASRVGCLFTTLATVCRSFQNWEWPVLSWMHRRCGVSSVNSPILRMQLSLFSPHLTRVRSRLWISSSCFWLLSADIVLGVLDGWQILPIAGQQQSNRFKCSFLLVRLLP